VTPGAQCNGRLLVKQYPGEQAALQARLARHHELCCQLPAVVLPGPAAAVLLLCQPQQCWPLLPAAVCYPEGPADSIAHQATTYQTTGRSLGHTQIKPLEQQTECNTTGRMQLSHVVCEEADGNKHGSDNQVWSQCWGQAIKGVERRVERCRPAGEWSC